MRVFKLVLGGMTFEQIWRYHDQETEAHQLLSPPDLPNSANLQPVSDQHLIVIIAILRGPTCGNPRLQLLRSPC